ncbi:MAG: GFA family protein [Alphaproteobacteria bacterium]
MGELYRGACFCGAVEFEAMGAPAVMGYCHCEDCRTWLGAPVSAFSLWPPDGVRITKGEENVAVFNKTENAYRKFCRTCGGPLMTDHPGFGLVDVYPSLMPDFTHVPTAHVFYERKTLSMKDGLPKFRDLPAEYGGSGETLPE